MRPENGNAKPIWILPHKIKRLTADGTGRTHNGK
jgi:hypothetical protein